MAYVSTSRWRQQAALVLARVLWATRDVLPLERAKALRAAYPFGERKHWPYKVWLDQLARMTGKKPRLGSRRPRTGSTPHEDARQLPLFP